MTVYDESTLGDISEQPGWFPFELLREPLMVREIDDGDEVVTPAGTLVVTQPSKLAYTVDGSLFVLESESFLRSFAADSVAPFSDPISWVGQLVPFSVLLGMYDYARSEGAPSVDGMPIEVLDRIVRILTELSNGTFQAVVNGEYTFPDLPFQVVIEGYDCTFDFVADAVDIEFTEDSGLSPLGVTVIPPEPPEPPEFPPGIVSPLDQPDPDAPPVNTEEGVPPQSGNTEDDPDVDDVGGPVSFDDNDDWL